MVIMMIDNYDEIAQLEIVQKRLPEELYHSHTQPYTHCLDVVFPLL